LRPKIGIILGTTRLTRFFQKCGAMGGRDDAEFVGRRSAHFENERSRILASPKRIVLRWGKKMAERAA
jgi:hypothetical protein